MTRRSFTVLALIALVLVALLTSPRFIREMRDFEVYWTAATRAVNTQPLYRADDGHFQFKYLPAFAIAAAPLAALSLPAAKTVWFAISAALLAALLALSVRLPPERRRPAWILVAVMIVTMGKFYGHELVLGQVNLLFAVLVVSGILALRRTEWAAGMLFVCAVVVKPYGAVFLPWLAATRQWTAAVVTATGVLLALAAPAVLYGSSGTVSLHRQWWSTVTASTAPNLTNPDNVSVAALAAKWSGAEAPVAAGLLSAVLVAIAGLVVYRGRGLKGREALEGALLLTLVPLLSPQGWDYVFLLATPAVVIVANYDRELPTLLRLLAWISLATIGLSIYDLMGRALYARFMSLSIVTLCFFVVVAALATLRLRRVA